MAIHAKANGLLIAGKIIDETEYHWTFLARDNRRPNSVSKSDTKNKVFHDNAPLEEILAWQESHKANRGWE